MERRSGRGEFSITFGFMYLNKYYFHFKPELIAQFDLIYIYIRLESKSANAAVMLLMSQINRRNKTSVSADEGPLLPSESLLNEDIHFLSEKVCESALLWNFVGVQDAIVFIDW